MPQKSIRKFSLFLLLIPLAAACSALNTDDAGMKYSPCKNSEVEEKIHQQQAALHLSGSGNQNIVVDCAADLMSDPVFLKLALKK
ncbi:hypothetical protein KKI24_12535 [bacterium]|nr:hypothetical protein [bacterium]